MPEAITWLSRSRFSRDIVLFYCYITSEIVWLLVKYQNSFLRNIFLSNVSHFIIYSCIYSVYTNCFNTIDT